jgi:hypothetical protein
MPRLQDEIRCTPEQLRILQTLCADHKIHCQQCQKGKEFMNLKKSPGFRSRGLGGWLCPDCKSDLKAAIKNHINTCENFSK